MNTTRPISIAVAALGGQGGGVLANWILDLAESNGYVAQNTSVPGVAQRTGATIYYLELFPESAIEAAGQQPVLAMMPVSGDVDICIASELMEAGRAIMRGLVSPDRTTLIASDHRVYSIAEKEVPGDGRKSAKELRDRAAEAAKDLVLFDMAKAAEDTASVISSVLFGALCGAGALPFSREAFENTIRASGRAVDSNLAGFARGFEGSQEKSVPDQVATKSAPQTSTHEAFAARVGVFPAEVHDTLWHGLRRLVDYQDRRYAEQYLDRLEPFKTVDLETLTEIGRHLALMMSFEDVIRVADLKTRAERFDGIATEVRAAPGQHWYAVEYFHPRYEEVCDSLPAGLGRATLNSKTLRKLLDPLISRGRLIKTGTVMGFLPLYFVSKLRRWRRGTYRFAVENGRIEEWLETLGSLIASNPVLAREVAECPRIIKGYSDTHERTLARYQRIMDSLEGLAIRPDAAEQVKALRIAALQDEEGLAFEAAWQKVA